MILQFNWTYHPVTVIEPNKRCCVQNCNVKDKPDYPN